MAAAHLVALRREARISFSQHTFQTQKEYPFDFYRLRGRMWWHLMMHIVRIDVHILTEGICREWCHTVTARTGIEHRFLITLECIRIRVRLQWQYPCHFVLIVVVDIVIDRIAGQFDVAQAQMCGHRFGNVHDFSVGRYHKYEAFQCLQQICAQLLKRRYRRIAARLFGAPCFAKACGRWNKYFMNNKWIFEFVTSREGIRWEEVTPSPLHNLQLSFCSLYSRWPSHDLNKKKTATKMSVLRIACSCASTRRPAIIMIEVTINRGRPKCYPLFKLAHVN